MSAYNTVFEASYYGLAVTLTLTLAGTILTGLKTRRGRSDPTSRHAALSAAVAALGAVVAVFGGAGVDTLAKSGMIGDVAYLQAEFSVLYAGFAMILAAAYIMTISASGSSNLEGATSYRRNLAAITWVPFVLALAVSASFLFNPGTYVITYSGGAQHVAQQGIYYLPILLTLASGITLSAGIALKSDDMITRRHATWFGFFAASSFLGVLKEANIIGSSGNPMTDLLGAFVPFTLGGLCLFISANKLGRHKPIFASFEPLAQAQIHLQTRRPLAGPQENT